MTGPANILDHYRDAHAQLVPEFAGGEWAASLRSKALEQLLKRGLPTTRDEDWKYTSLRPIARQAFQYSGQVPTEADAGTIDRHSLSGFDSWRLVFVNGRYTPALSDVVNFDGLTVRPLADVLEQDPAHVQSALDTFSQRDGDPFLLLNSAFIDSGLVIDLGKDASAPRPIYVLMLSSGDDRLVCHPRILLRAGQSSKLTLIEHYAGDAANFTNVVANIDLAGQAQIEHYRINVEGPEAAHISGTHVNVSRDARYINHNFCLGGRLVRNDINVALSEPGAETELNGLYLLDGKAHVDNHTTIDHVAPMTRSAEDYRGVLRDRSRAVYNGKVIVREDAQKTDAWQSNRNLLLSDAAEVDTKPELEIYADDVKCGHGATVGQLDKDALFYLLSRGIDHDTASGLLIFAFVDDVIARGSLDEIRRQLEKWAIGRLPDATRIEEFV